MPGVPQAQSELGPVPASDFGQLGSHCRWEHAARRPGLHTTLNCKHYSHIFTVFVLLKHPESTCCSEPWWFQFLRLRSSIDVWLSSSCAVQTSPRRWLSSYLIFLTRVLDSKNNHLASQVVWGFLICIFKAFVVTRTIPILHHFTSGHLEDIF